MWNPHFTVHCTAVSYELKHISDLSMLVFYFWGHAFVVYLRTIKVHNDSIFKELTVHFLLQKSHHGTPPCLRISKRKYLPMPSEFHNRKPPLPFGNPKSRPWYKYGHLQRSSEAFWKLLQFSEAIGNYLRKFRFCGDKKSHAFYWKKVGRYITGSDTHILNMERSYITTLRCSACQTKIPTDDQCSNWLAYSVRSNFSAFPVIINSVLLFSVDEK